MADIVPIKKHAAYERQNRQSAAGCLRGIRAEYNPKQVLVMGFDENDQFFVRGSPPDPAEAMWLMELAKKRLTRAFD